jgi:DNA-binding response OmpR family regulator
MMDTQELSVDQTVGSLQEAFVHSLPKRLREIEACWAEVLNSDGSRAHLANFVGAIHYLAGGSGVHGFVSMSRLSYRIISHLRPCLDKNVSFSKEIRSIVEKILETLLTQSTYYGNQGAATPLGNGTAAPTADSHTLASENTSNDICILEHNPDEELAIKVFLENAGYRIRSFKSLHKLLKAIHEIRPHAVILDLQQCNQDATAPEFLTALRRQDIPYPIFMLSDSGAIDARLQSAKMGASHFFLKPIDGYRLVDSLHKATSKEGEVASRVLLVDDDPETAQYIAVHLLMEGLNVQVINDPLEVFETVASFHPDLILTDLYMPGCSGLELATMVRQHEVFYDIPIVFLTSEAEANTRLAALQLGSDDFFTKSTDTAIVARAIKSRLQRMASYKLVKRAMIWSPN